MSLSVRRRFGRLARHYLTRVNRRLRSLSDRGLVDCRVVHLGRAHRRWWLLSDPGSPVLPARLRLHPPHQLVRMLGNLQFVAEVYSICSKIVDRGGGDLVDFWWTV